MVPNRREIANMQIICFLNFLGNLNKYRGVKGMTQLFYIQIHQMRRN
ncbi:Uncharacterised protein [Neisseria gonorrhoeae]|uniref:Uncharacterized protein n=1 Tax=Neisseria gonorrhoeae TaxID=485 RepID=A0A379B2K6_NEIGO|nr:Uncharacterised protein [Neisseria gonorrhoeae]